MTETKVKINMDEVYQKAKGKAEDALNKENVLRSLNEQDCIKTGILLKDGL